MTRRLRRRKPGTVHDLSGVLWRAIAHIEQHLDASAKAEQPNISEMCKMAHALAQSANVYIKALEVGDMEQRLEALEKAYSASQHDTFRRAA